MTQMRLLALLAYFLAGTYGVPISPNADLRESVPMGDMPAQGTPVIQSSPPGSEVLIQAQHVPHQFQPKSSRVQTGSQPQLTALNNLWASQPNPNSGLSQLPAHFQYFQYPHPQQQQFFYYPVLGPQSRNPTFSYGAPVFQHATSQHYPAHAVPASRPLMAQTKQQKPNAHQIQPNQPQQQQVQQFLYMVPQLQQQRAGPYGGMSSEELQNMERMGRMGHVGMHMPAFRGNMFPVAGRQPFLSVSPLRPANTFHINTFPATGMTFSTNTDVQQPSVVAVPPSGDAIPATGGSPPNNGALPNRVSSMQDLERVPCDHVQSAEKPLTNTGALSSGHGTFISGILPNVQPDPHYIDPNLVPTTSPTPEEHLIPASDTVDTNADIYP